MKISQAFPSKYVSSTDLGGKELTLTVSHVTVEEVGQNEMKPVMYFNGAQKGMVLNKTNATHLASLYGDDTDMWAGNAVTLFTIVTEYQGKVVDGLRVKRPPAPATPTPAAAIQQQQLQATTNVEPGDPLLDEDTVLGSDNIPF